jgi:hypothetical protein
VSILDAPAYPFHLPAAQQLHDTLVTLYPTDQAALLLAKRAGIDTGWIFGNQAIIPLWKDLLEAGAKEHRLGTLVRDAHDRLAADHPARDFLAELLAGRTPVVTAEPRAADLTPAFIHDDDTLSEPEAMLFRDDLTVTVGRLPSLVATLGRMIELAPAVCKLTVAINTDEQWGTGFRIGPDRLLTNWHVLHRRSDGVPATAVTAEFGFEDDPDGALLSGTAVRCDPVPVAADEADDWAVVRTLDPLDDAWPVIDLAGAAEPTTKASAYVIQHPLGGRKRLGFVRNQVAHVDERIVHYLTDTDIGSSGAPVLDAQGRLIALHHRGGRPQAVAGRPPVRKNEGIRISRIVAGLGDR